MASIKNNPTKLLGIICGVLLIALLILQFVPYWSFGSPEQTVSISGYVWFPHNHAEIDTALSASAGRDVDVNNVFGSAVLLLAACVVGIIAFLANPESVLSALMPLLAGLLGCWQYLLNPLYRLGSGWVLHFIVCVALIALAGVLVAHFVKAFAQTKAAK